MWRWALPEHQKDGYHRTSESDPPEGMRMASGRTGNAVPGNRLRVRLPCPPLC